MKAVPPFVRCGLACLWILVSTSCDRQTPPVVLAPEVVSEETLPGEENISSLETTLNLETNALPLTVESTELEVTTLTPQSWVVEMESDLVGMAFDGEHLFVATAESVWRVGGDELYVLEYVPEEGSPDSLGTIVALLERENGILVRTTEGLFENYEWALVFSPLNDAFDASLDVATLAEVGGATDLSLFVSTPSDVFYLSDTRFDRLILEDEGLVASALATTSTGALIAGEAGLLDVTIESLEAQVGSTELFGTIASMAGRDGLVGIASTLGTFFRDGEGAYHGLGSAPALGTAFDRAGRAIFLLEDSVLRSDTTQVETFGTWESEASPTAIGVDEFNHVWTFSGTQLTRWEVGNPLSFEESIAPVFESRCNGCHLEGTPGPKHDFSDYGEVFALQDSVLERVALGLMPPGGLPSDELEMVLLWFQGGINP